MSHIPPRVVYSLRTEISTELGTFSFHFLEYGIFRHGFARIRCGNCYEEDLLAVSCKTRYFCPSCQTKRVAAVLELVTEEVLEAVDQRLPEALRFLLGDLNGYPPFQGHLFKTDPGSKVIFGRWSRGLSAFYGVTRGQPYSRLLNPVSSLLISVSLFQPQQGGSEGVRHLRKPFIVNISTIPKVSGTKFRPGLLASSS